MANFGGQQHKACPRCGLPTELSTAICTRCQHQFRTQFAPQDATQVFPGPPGGQPSNPYPSPDQPQKVGGPLPPPHGFHQPPQTGYPRQPIGLQSFSMPPGLCLLIGIILPVAGIVLGVLFFTLPSMYNPACGRASIIGAALNMVLFCGLFGLGMFLR